MREFVVQQSLTRQSYGGFSVVVRMFRNWRMQKTYRHMQGLEDHMLRDIGLSREDLRQLMAMPLDADVAWELERRRLLASRQTP